ncbi:alcohol dehydrogenase 1-like [Manduca sexta]|nr:alcohol dehydrogenase 1-like [Manduca sexta]
MRKDRGGKGGTIINISSISGFLVDPFITSYKASKYAIIGLTLGLGHEYNYKTSAVRVVAICPGFTSSDMTDGQMVVDEQASIFDKFRSSLIWQTPDVLGKNAIKVFQEADTGSIWVSEEGKDAEIAPARKVVTLSQLESL